ncbi:expressed unknown protein [Seminavis robusta]|uniref:CRAL-TRIO domain-containing protein n=1 Tax=Seminavis robusta TaxID=568900 RepID=A0A9N8DUF0_9STRA|nr:expressed unknown protein [Seminavis robusta]|eukprot:Sro365_g127290.1 n/a (355) ;mRNA; f:826-1890
MRQQRTSPPREEESKEEGDDGIAAVGHAPPLQNGQLVQAACRDLVHLDFQAALLEEGFQEDGSGEESVIRRRESESQREPEIHEDTFAEEPSYDDGKMMLTDEEYQWARDIKSAAQLQPDLDKLPDFWYAQIALCDQGDVDAALHRIHGLQTFWKEYKVILDNLNSARKVVRESLEDLFPGFWLSLTYSPTAGHYTLVMDAVKLDMSVLATHPQAMDSLILSMFYVLHAANPDFETIRHGLYSIAECEGQDWKNSMGAGDMRRVWTEIASVYPIRYQKLDHIHTNMVVNMMWSLAKRYLPKNIRDKFDARGCSDVERLDKLYSIPTLEAANGRFLGTVMDSLKKRLENEASFSL